MAKITSIRIQDKDKNRCSVFIDEEFFRGFSLEIAYKFHLKNGMEIEKDKLSELCDIAEVDEAYNLAVNYLSKYIKTKREIKDYLLKKEYSENTAYKVIDKLKSIKLIDDVNFSKLFIQFNYKKIGKKLIEYRLMMKGVKKQDIELAYNELSLDVNEGVYNLAKKHLKNKEINFENLQKTFRYLTAKGFSFEEINNAMSKIKSNYSEE